MILVKPDMILLNERSREYLKVMEIVYWPESSPCLRDGGFYWLCSKWQAGEWTTPYGGYTSVELNTCYREVKRLEAAVLLGIRV